ncbi:hypothetical protein CASFOL_022751 [Castilleja foliolosa]|uniref:Uncharacterized protein n=1 Tax=Castilleja foliolosa TaxID=1961234 RepID=A0ABD3CUJ8_9LAMI
METHPTDHASSSTAIPHMDEGIHHVDEAIHHSDETIGADDMDALQMSDGTVMIYKLAMATWTLYRQATTMVMIYRLATTTGTLYVTFEWEPQDVQETNPSLRNGRLLTH